MNLTFSDLTSVQNFDDWADSTEALFQYSRRNHQDTLTELQALYPRTWDTHMLAPIPFIWRVCRELATLYRRRPNRRHLGEGITFDVQRRINSIYRAIDMDWKFQTMHENLIAMNNASMWFFPIQTDAFSGVEVLVIPPHHCKFQMKPGRASSTAMLDVERVWVKLPVHRDAEVGIIRYGVAEITATTAIWSEAPEELLGTGLWFADKSNPIGRIPCIYMRGTEPAPGEWHAPVDNDLLQAQRALSLGWSDIQNISRKQGFQQGIMMNMSQAQAEDLEIGPESVIGLMEGQDFKFVGGSPPLREYQAAVEGYLATILAHLGLSPEIFLKQKSVSAIAKTLDRMDREEGRQRWINQFERSENEAWEFIRLWINHLRGNGTEVYPFADVEIRYFEAKQAVDPLHEAQAQRMRIMDGSRTAAQLLAEETGITEDEAKEQVRLNLEETRKNQEILAPDHRIEQGRVTESERELSVL